MWWRCEGFVWSLSYPRPNYSSLLAANGSECGEAKTALKSVHPPVTFPPPPHFKLGFLYSYFNGFIFFFFSLTYIWLWAWWKAAVGGFSSLLSFRWKECGISSDLIPCQIKIHFSQQLSANVNNRAFRRRRCRDDDGDDEVQTRAGTARLLVFQTDFNLLIGGK